MAAKIPVKAIYTGSDVTSLGEFTSSDTIAGSYLADGSVTAAKLAADAATQAELDAVSTVASAALPKAGGTLTGNVTLEAITETKTTKSASFTPDLTNDGTIYSCSGTMTITMPSASSGKSFTIIHATATSITWAGTIKWNGGSAPTAGSGIDIYVFVSDGTNWYANQAGTGYA
tara:strand:- start:635 stop:1156 length:522 start_codon:yes stop_codon:yes gene_type:complete